MRIGFLFCASLVGLAPTATATAAPAKARLEHVGVEGSIGRTAARRGLRRRLAAVRRCVAKHLKQGRTQRAKVTLTVEGGRVTAVRISGAVEAKLQRCLEQALRGFAGKKTSKGSVTAKLRLTHPRVSRAARRRALLAQKIASMGALKILGTRGSASPSVLSSGSSGSGIGGLGGGGLYRTPVENIDTRRRRARRERERKKRARMLAKALQVPKARGRPAGWVQPEFSKYDTTWFPKRRRTVAMSKDAAIVSVSLSYLPARAETKRSKTLYLAVHRTRGVVGVVTPPVGVVQWGLDEQGTINVVTRAGQLYHARSLDAMVKPSNGAWSPVARFEKAHWDLAPGLIVAVKGRTVHVSKDGGRTFKTIYAPTTSPLNQVKVRFDGVIVIRSAQGGTFISPDRGRTWERSSFQPGYLYRRGAWIYANNKCDHASLSTDKRTWIQGDPPSVLKRYRAPRGGSRSWRRGMRWWEALVDTSEKPVSFAVGRFPTPSDPPPPEVSKRSTRVTGEPEKCRGAARIGGLGTSTGSPGGCGYGARGKGFLAQCVRGTIGHKPHVSTLWVGWLADGVTDSSGGAARPPSMVLVDHRQGKLTFGAVPQGCKRPIRIRSLRGIAMLVCDKDRKSQLFVTDAKGTWHEEALLDAPAERLEWFLAAPDGTLLVQSCHFDREREKKEGTGHLCDRAFVRRPTKLGSAGAWRQVRVTDALTYRPLRGGRALVVDRVGAGNGAIQLLVDGPRRTRVLARKVKVGQDLQNIFVEQGRILVRLGGYSEHVLTKKRTFAVLPSR